jgi:hypothetical protein
MTAFRIVMPDGATGAGCASRCAARALNTNRLAFSSSAEVIRRAHLHPLIARILQLQDGDAPKSSYRCTTSGGGCNAMVSRYRCCAECRCVRSCCGECYDDQRLCRGRRFAVRQVSGPQGSGRVVELEWTLRRRPCRRFAQHHRHRGSSRCSNLRRPMSEVLASSAAARSASITRWVSGVWRRGGCERGQLRRHQYVLCGIRRYRQQQLPGSFGSVHDRDRPASDMQSTDLCSTSRVARPGHAVRSTCS